MQGANNRAAWKWTEDAFQTVAYWLGFQHKRFRHYPIREIAVVTELTALLYAPGTTARAAHRMCAGLAAGA
jgi:hypothetical protein